MEIIDEAAILGNKVFCIEELCGEVGKYLPLIQLYVLSEDSVWKFKSVPIGPELIKRLEEKGKGLSKILDHLNDNAVLSGSFLLSVLVSPKIGGLGWISDDIDVYCRKEGSCMENKVCGNCGHDIAYYTLFSEGLCHMGAVMEDLGLCYPIMKIIGNRKWKLSGQIINTVTIDVSQTDIKQFIFDTFDFDFCKVTYDGKKLSIFDINSIFKKSCKFRGDKEALKYFGVIDGYQGDVSTNLDFRLSRLHSTYTMRRNKYEKRGFEIINCFDPSWNYDRKWITEEAIEKIIKKITEIRKLPGYCNHLLPPSFRQIDPFNCSIIYCGYCKFCEKLDHRIKRAIYDEFPNAKLTSDIFSGEIWLKLPNTFNHELSTI